MLADKPVTLFAPRRDDEPCEWNKGHIMQKSEEEVEHTDSNIIQANFTQASTDVSMYYYLSVPNN